MVPLNTSERQRQIDNLRQSADLNIRDLVAREDMPLPLAVYLWCVRRNRLSLVNGDLLAQWGRSWVRRVLIEQEIGAREDEEVSAAALAAVALHGTPDLHEWEDNVRAGLLRLASAAFSRNLVAYSRPAYAALLLLALVTYNVEEPRLSAAVHATAQTFIQAVPGGRLFGVGFLMEVLGTAGDETDTERLRAALLPAAANTSTQYEDRTYALHALWLDASRLASSSSHTEEIAELVERELEGSPAWPFVMAGDETVSSAAGSDDRVVLSPLFRAILLDLALGAQTEANTAAAARAAAMYRGDRAIVASAFTLWSVALLTLSSALLLVVAEHLGTMYHYFILHQYSAAQGEAVLLFALAVAGLGYLAPFTVVTIARLWHVMIMGAVQSDRRAREVIGSSAVQVFRLWRYIVLSIVIGLVASFLYPAVEHLVGSK